MHRSTLLARLIVVLALAQAGCTITATGISAELPILPGDYHRHPGAAVQRWQVRWWDGRAVRERTVGAGAEASAHRGSPRFVPLDIAGTGAPMVLVHARPITTGGVRLAGAGAWSASASQPLALAWADGEWVSVLLELARDGLDPALINVERLQALVDQRTDGGRWPLDRARLAGALRSSSMRSSAVSTLYQPPVDVRIAGAEAAPLLSDRPALAAEGEHLIAATRAGEWTVWAVPCATGQTRHLWFNDGRRLVVARDRQGRESWRVFERP